MHDFKLNITKTVTAVDLSYILCAAVEGGSNYWLNDYSPVATREVIEGSGDDSQNYVALTLQVPAPDDTAECCEPAKVADITLDSIAKAIAALSSDPAKYKVYEGYTFDLENYDAGDADLVLQVAVFDEVVYG